MDSVAVNGIRYEVVKATKQEFVETSGCDEDDCAITKRSDVIAFVDGEKVYIDLGYRECDPATLQQPLERIASEICY